MTAAGSHETGVGRRREAWLRTSGLSRKAVLVVAAAVVAVQLVVAVSNLWGYAKIGYRNAMAPNPLVRDADLDPLATYVPTAVLARAEQTIPREASYSIVFGKDAGVDAPSLVPIVFRFWLEPRPYAKDPAKADWVIAYGASSESLGVRYSREVGLSPSVNAVQVVR